MDLSDYYVFKGRKGGQEEAADACIGPPFQRRILHWDSARRQVRLVWRGRSAAGRSGNLLWQEKRVDLRVCVTGVVMAA